MNFKRNIGKKVLTAFILSQGILLPISSAASSNISSPIHNETAYSQNRESLEYLNGAAYYNQAEEPYRSYPYGEGEFGKMINTGCGPAVMAMAASTLLEEKITPIEMADLAVQTENIMAGNNGTLWQFFYDASDYLNLKITATNSQEEVLQALSDGKMVINSVNSSMGGYWTQYGHFILLTAVEDGMVAVNDPAYRSKSKLHSLETVFGPSKQMWIIEK